MNGVSTKNVERKKKRKRCSPTSRARNRILAKGRLKKKKGWREQLDRCLPASKKKKKQRKIHRHVLKAKSHNNNNYSCALSSQSVSFLTSIFLLFFFFRAKTQVTGEVEKPRKCSLRLLTLPSFFFFLAFLFGFELRELRRQEKKEDSLD